MVEVRSPFPEFEVPRVWDWVQTFRGKVCDDYSVTTQEAFVEQTLGQLRSGVRSWAIYRDGELGGMLTFQAWNPRVGTAHTIIKRAFWGRGTTETALRLIADEIFAGTTEKITAYFFEDNHAMRGLMRILGAKREGWFEAQTLRNGKPTAMEAVGLFKDKFYATCSSNPVDNGRTRGGIVDHRLEIGQNDDEHAELHPGAVGGTEHPGEVDRGGSGEPGESRPAEDGGDGHDQYRNRQSPDAVAE